MTPSMVAGSALARQRFGYRFCRGAVVAVGALLALNSWWRDAVAGRWPDFSQDAYLYYLPNLLYLRDSLARGHGLLWNGLQNCGQPAFGNGQIPALDPTAWLFAVFDPLVALTLIDTLALCLGPLGVVALARRLRLHPAAAFAGAIALMTADRTAQLGAWQPTWFVAYMWMPWVLVAAERALRRADSPSAVWLGIALTLQFLAGAPQCTLFTYEVLALRGLWELARRPRRWRGVAALAGGAALPLGLAAVKLLPALDFNALSIRGAGLDRADLLGDLDILGRRMTPTWAEFRQRLPRPLSDSFICQPWFLGLALLGGCSPARRRLGLFYLGTAILFLALSFDGPLFEIYRRLPFGEVFRLPARFRCVTSMLGAVLAALGAHAFLLTLRRPGWRRVAVVAMPLLGVAAFAGLAGARLDRFALYYAGGLSGVAAVAAAIGPPRRAGRAGRWLLAAWAVLLPALMVCIGMMMPRSAPAPARAQTLFARAADLAPLAALPSDERVYVFRDKTARAREDWSVNPKSASLFGFRSVADFEPQVSRRFADLLLALRGGGAYRTFASFEFYSEEPRNRALLDLVAARYLVANTEAPPALDRPTPPVREVRRDGSFWVFENPTALPRALYVPVAEVVDDPAAILARLATADHDPRRVALLEQPPADGFLGTPSSAGSATIAADRGEEVRVTVRADAPGFLFLSDQDYPGWSATVNGVATPIQRANYAFRLVRVPGGASEVVFRYAPRSLRWGALMSLATLVAILAGWIRRQ